MLSWDRTINKDLSNHDALLRKLFPESFEDNTESLLHENLVPILLEKNAYAIGHKLTEFHLEKLGVKIIAIRRYKEKPLKPPKKLIFQKHDIVLLYGSPDSIEDAELLLLEGP
jgi:CPA2 family monovalent cation:H+ antiporter-2